MSLFPIDSEQREIETRLEKSLSNSLKSIHVEDLAASLRWAVFNGRTDLVPKFLSMAQGARMVLDATDGDGRTPLILATLSDHLEIIQILVDALVNLDFQVISTGQSAVMIAASKGNFEAVRLMVNAGAKLSLIDHDGHTALMLASKLGHHRVTQTLASHRPTLDLFNARLKTALHLAAENGREKCVWVLLEAGADPFIVDADGKSVILCCVEMNFYSTASQLVGGILSRLTQQGDEGGRAGVLHPLDVADSSGFTPLIIAARDGYAQIAELLLISGSSVQLRDHTGKSSLAHAAAAGHQFIITRLIESKAHVDEVDNDGRTPLFLTVMANRPDCTLELLRAKANPLISDSSGLTPMLFSAKNGYRECVDALLIGGGYSTERDNRGYTPLMIAVENLHGDCVGPLVKLAPASLNLQADDGTSALILAAKIGDPNILATILNANPSLALKKNDGDTALLTAIKSRHEFAVEKLAVRHPVVNERDANGLTALMIAAAEERPQCVQALISAGSDMDLQDPQGRSALVIAFINDSTESFSRMAKAGAKSDVQDGSGETLLMLAAKRNKPDFVQRLCRDARSNPNIADKNGDTALHHAARLGFAKCIIELAEAEANLDAENKAGVTALRDAARLGFFECVVELEARGADKFADDPQGKTALHFSAENQHVEITKYLLASAPLGRYKVALTEMPHYGGGINELISLANLYTRLSLSNLVQVPSLSHLSLGSVWKLDGLVRREIEIYSRQEHHAGLAMRALAIVPNMGLAGNHHVRQLLTSPHVNMRLPTSRLIAYDVPTSSVGTLMLITNPWDITNLNGNPLIRILDAIDGISYWMEANDVHRVHQLMLNRRKEDLMQLAATLFGSCVDEKEAAGLLDEIHTLPSGERAITVLERGLDLGAKKLLAESLAQNRVNQLWNRGAVRPWVVYWLRTISTLLFCLLIMSSSFFKVHDYRNQYRCDIALLVWSLGLLYQEIIDLVERTATGSFLDYFRNERNILDLSTYLLLTVATSLRVFTRKVLVDGMTPLEIDEFEYNFRTTGIAVVSDGIQAVGTVLALLQFFWVAQLNYSLGPLLLIIANMIQGLLTFVIILGTVLAFFTLAIARLHLNAGNWELFKYLFWTLLGGFERFLNELTNPPELPKCELSAGECDYIQNLQSLCQPDQFEHVAIPRMIMIEALFGTYSIIAVIMLLNLLIAILNNAYTTVVSDADTEWKFMRTKLIVNLSTRIDKTIGKATDGFELATKVLWLAPAPLNFIFIPFHIFAGVKYLFAEKTEKYEGISVAVSPRTTRLRSVSYFLPPESVSDEKKIGRMLYDRARFRGTELPFMRPPKESAGEVKLAEQKTDKKILPLKKIPSRIPSVSRLDEENEDLATQVKTLRANCDAILSLLSNNDKEEEEDEVLDMNYVDVALA